MNILKPINNYNAYSLYNSPENMSVERLLNVVNCKRPCVSHEVPPLNVHVYVLGVCFCACSACS